MLEGQKPKHILSNHIYADIDNLLQMLDADTFPTNKSTKTINECVGFCVIHEKELQSTTRLTADRRLIESAEHSGS